MTAGSGETLDRWNTQAFPVVHTFGLIFSFIADRWRDLSAVVKDSLRSSSLIPVGSQLAKPSRVFFRLAEDLSPFMHEIPRVFGAHEGFLKEIGVRERPSPGDYVQFLAELAMECGTTALNPNELKAIIAIVQAIVVQFEQGSIDNATPAKSFVFVPDENGVLRDSRFLLYNDNVWMRSRIDMSVVQSTINLYVLHPCFSRNVSSVLGISPLSSVLGECLSASFVPVGIADEQLITEHYKKVLSSNEFIEALLLIEAKSAPASDSHSLPRNLSLCRDSRVLADIAAAISSIEIRFFQDIQVDVLVTSNIRVPLGMKRSGEVVIVQRNIPSFCFVSRTGRFAEATKMAKQRMLVNLKDCTATYSSTTEKETIYVNYGSTSNVGSVLSASLALCLGICNIFQLDSVYASLLANVLQAGIQLGTDRMPEILYNLEVAADAAIDRERSRGLPGYSVLPCDEAMLELKPFRSFRVGEIVAIAHSGELKGYIYAAVVEVGEAGPAGLRSLLLRTGEGVISCAVTDVYSFRSARTDGADSRTVRGSRITECAQPALKFPAGKAPSQSKTDKSQAFSRTENSELSTQRADVMNALSGLLSRAGIPVSMETEVDISSAF
jgi:hypothetical protein